MRERYREYVRDPDDRYKGIRNVADFVDYLRYCWEELRNRDRHVAWDDTVLAPLILDQSATHEEQETARKNRMRWQRLMGR